MDLLSFAVGKASSPSVEVESKTITANGTYTAATGKAYSPVVVSVPELPNLEEEEF